MLWPQELSKVTWQCIHFAIPDDAGQISAYASSPLFKLAGRILLPLGGAS